MEIRGLRGTPCSRDFCVPGEYYANFLEISSNPIKDFAKCSILKWKPRNLITLTASRLKTYLELVDSIALEEVADLDVSQPKSALTFLNHWLPDSITTPVGYQEDSILYALRHTQLLPRHLFIILNTIFSAKEDTLEFTENEFKEGIIQTSHIVVNEIFGSYNHKHPNASKVCRRVIPNMPEVFKYGEIHKAFNRYARRDYDYLEDFIDMLFDIGALGKVVDISDKYIHGQYQYNYDAPLVASDGDKLCIHPVFRLMFPDKPGVPYSRVWPVGVENS